MKHLKKYKIFESDEYRKDFEQDIKDICLELSDIHIHVNIGQEL